MAANALKELTQYVSCGVCSRFLSRQCAWLRPCDHFLCEQCVGGSKCKVCWGAVTSVVYSPTIARVAALLAGEFPEARKTEYSVTLAVCTMPGVKSLLQEPMQITVFGDASVAEVSDRVCHELDVSTPQLAFRMCGELLTGSEMLSELVECFEDRNVVLECGVLSCNQTSGA